MSAELCPGFFFLYLSLYFGVSTYEVMFCLIICMPRHSNTPLCYLRLSICLFSFFACVVVFASSIYHPNRAFGTSRREDGANISWFITIAVYSYLLFSFLRFLFI